MKRILCLIENLGSGGAERQISGLAVLLKQQGHEVEVWYYLKKDFFVPYLTDNGVTSRFFIDMQDKKLRFFNLHKHIKEFNPDTIISYSASPSMICCVLKLMGSDFRLIVSERSTTQKFTWREKLRFALYRWADYIVPNSYSQAKIISGYSKRLTDKIKVITNYVDTNRFSPSEPKESIRENAINMICVGSRMKPKNIPVFIEAVHNVIADGYRLHVDWYGKDLHDEYSALCNATIKKFELGDDFVFHQPVSDIETKYREADVFCLPSIYEGFPNVLCEAMCCGLPVLCSDVSDNSTIMQNGKNGLLFCPQKVSDIVQVIERFMKFTDYERASMGVCSREMAKQQFTEKKFIEHYLNILG